MHCRTHIWTKDGFATILACADAAITRPREGITRPTSSRWRHTRSMIPSKKAFVPFNKSKVNPRNEDGFPKAMRMPFMLSFVSTFSERLHKFIMERYTQSQRVPLCINPQSAAYKSFARFVCPSSSSSCMHFLNPVFPAALESLETLNFEGVFWKKQVF